MMIHQHMAIIFFIMSSIVTFHNHIFIMVIFSDSAAGLFWNYCKKPFTVFVFKNANNANNAGHIWVCLWKSTLKSKTYFIGFHIQHQMALLQHTQQKLQGEFNSWFNLRFETNKWVMFTMVQRAFFVDMLVTSKHLLIPLEYVWNQIINIFIAIVFHYLQ